MKKTFISSISGILLICMLFSCVSCTAPTPSDEDTTTSYITDEPTEAPTEEPTEKPTEVTEEPTTEEPTTEEPTEVETENEDEKYKDIKCISPKGYEKRYFGKSGSSYALSVVLPEEWEFTSKSSAYMIKRGKENIGKAVMGSSGEAAGWTVVKEKSAASDDLSISSYIERSGSGDSLEFRYRFHFVFTDGGEQYELALTVNYEEICTLAEQKIRTFSDVEQIANDPRVGDLGHIPTDKGILILGNSFIGTSQIGSILEEMCALNNKSCSITAISRGYAEVDTYANDVYTVSEIQAGFYNVVFLCGFYSYDRAETITTLINACKASGTELILLPAYNEAREVISHIQKKHKQLDTLDWKAELNALIEQGVDKWDLCYNDAHLHSTPLAGYVGAHMIYRALFGEIPAGKLSQNISQSTVKSKLGAYITNGIAYTVNTAMLVSFD